MNTDKAIYEAQRWLGYLDAQGAKAKRLAELARLAKTDHAEALRQKRQMDAAPTVYDGGNLEPAVRFLIAEIERLNSENTLLRTGDTCARQCEGIAFRHEAQRLKADNQRLEDFVSGMKGIANTQGEIIERLRTLLREGREIAIQRLPHKVWVKAIDAALNTEDKT